MSLLSVRGLSVSLGPATVLDGVSFDVAAGEFVGLIGPNGAGKSTLLKAALGLIPARGGVALAGRDAAAMGARERARCVGYLPQEREVAWAVPVDMVVALGRAPHRPGFGPLARADRDAVEAAMRRMDVEHLRHRPATELSGGELARVLIARVLAQEAPLLLADEPTAGLDPAHQIALMRNFRNLARDGCGVLASLHDLALAARWCSRLMLVHEKRIIADGPPGTVLASGAIERAFGITIHSKRVDGHWIVQPLDLAPTYTGAEPR